MRLLNRRRERVYGSKHEGRSRGRRFELFSVAALTLFFGCTVPDTNYCGSSADCPSIVGGSDSSDVCHPTRHVCIPYDPSMCSSDDECKDLTLPHCNLSSTRCEPCVLDSLSDVSCKHNTQTPHCGSAPSGGTMCVACRKNVDCPASSPICDGQSCRKCQKHSDCEGDLQCDSGPCTDSMVCISAAHVAGDIGADLVGQCAMNGVNGRVVYAFSDTAMSICKDDDGRTGTDMTQPFCSLDKATTEAGPTGQNRTFVRAIDGGVSYSLVMSGNKTLSSRHLVFVGAPARGGKTMATVSSYGTLFEVNSSTTSLTSITVESWNLLETQADMTMLKCTGTSQNTPTFAVLNSVVKGSTYKAEADVGGAAAIDLANCKAQLLGNIIGLSSADDVSNMNAPAHTRGLRLTNDSSFTGASFLIENNIIAGNWGMAIDMDAVYLKTVTLHFNTIVYNGRDTSLFGGIRCPSKPITLPISNSIIWANGSSSGSQFMTMGTNNCTFNQLIVGASESNMTTGLLRQDPVLNSQFYLQKGSFGVDQAQLLTSETAPLIDIVGTKRPQGTANDIGAFELLAN